MSFGDHFHDDPGHDYRDEPGEREYMANHMPHLIRRGARIGIAGRPFSRHELRLLLAGMHDGEARVFLTGEIRAREAKLSAGTLAGVDQRATLSHLRSELVLRRAA